MDAYFIAFNQISKLYSPYLPPEPFKGQENKSSNIKYIIQRIAQIKKKSYQEIEALTTENALRLFKKIK